MTGSSGRKKGRQSHNLFYPDGDFRGAPDLPDASLFDIVGGRRQAFALPLSKHAGSHMALPFAQSSEQ
jgi:hypothetical protein